MLKITPEAKNYIKKNLQEAQEKILTIDVGPGGCSGLTYIFSHDQPLAEDEKITCDEFEIVIKQKAVLFIIGTTLDYEKTETSAKLVFKNPNEKNKCGCGKSFSI